MSSACYDADTGGVGRSQLTTDDDPVCAQCKTATVTTLSAETPITGGATKSISAASLVNGLYGRRRSLRATFGL